MANSAKPADQPSTSRRRRRVASSDASESWPAIRDALEAALSLSPEDRRAHLEAELVDSPAALARALALLGRDDEAPVTVTPLEAGLPGAGIRIGPWVTRKRLGSGGMGEVYLASRADGAFERLVALKLIRPRAGSDDLLPRFRRERQLQAALEHPGIARMLDGGATDDGAPYIVMEFVDGLTIARYCDEHRLTILERVELFSHVVDAVAYAHEHRIVHRDLKPSNVLVGSDGHPKLVDFGIAKGLDPSPRIEEALTQTGAGFLTPAYASPEQLRGLPTPRRRTSTRSARSCTRSWSIAHRISWRACRPRKRSAASRPRHRSLPARFSIRLKTCMRSQGDAARMSADSAPPSGATSIGSSCSVCAKSRSGATAPPLRSRPIYADSSTAAPLKHAPTRRSTGRQSSSSATVAPSSRASPSWPRSQPDSPILSSKTVASQPPTER